jgi:hypothetical protein
MTFLDRYRHQAGFFRGERIVHEHRAVVVIERDHGIGPALLHVLRHRADKLVLGWIELVGICSEGSRF